MTSREWLRYRKCLASEGLIFLHASIIIKGAIARMGLRLYPLSLSFELTWLCNLACKYCDRHTPMPNELSREGIFAALSEFYDLGMRDVCLDGGEALAHRYVDEIVDWLVQRRIAVSMNSNGILVPRKIETVRKLSKLKISLDGAAKNHDAMRGAGSFEKALGGVRAAKAAGVAVEFSCTVGRHNANSLEEALEIGEALEIPVIFQPARNSLFQKKKRDGSAWQLDGQRLQHAFGRIEKLKREGRGVGNRWASLRHFRRFPEETHLPCTAGRVFCTMDPEGVLYSCGQLDRSDRCNNVARLGVARAFANLSREGCGECWGARQVEENYLWGCRIDRLLPPLGV